MFYEYIYIYISDNIYICIINSIRQCYIYYSSCPNRLFKTVYSRYIIEVNLCTRYMLYLYLYIVIDVLFCFGPTNKLR